MKKIWTGFWLAMAIPALAAAAGAMLAPFVPIAGAALLLAGAAAGGWWYTYFKHIDYADSGTAILIRSGLLIRKSKRLYKGNILWTNCIKLLGKPVVTVLHTGGGSVVVFAAAELPDP